jgi:hypothetical protein
MSVLPDLNGEKHKKRAHSISGVSRFITGFNGWQRQQKLPKTVLPGSKAVGTESSAPACLLIMTSRCVHTLAHL